MPNFTTQELNLIAPERKPASLRPVYYDATQKVLSTISEDFEAFLILQGSESKQKALAWITDAIGLDTKREDQNNILGRFIGLRAEDAAKRTSEISQVMEKYDAFKTDFLTDGTDSSRFADIAEVNIFLQSVQRPLGDIATRRERAVHETNMATLQQAKLDQSKVSKDTLRELESWQTVMSAYKGQSGKQTTQTGSTPLGGLRPT